MAKSRGPSQPARKSRGSTASSARRAVPRKPAIRKEERPSRRLLRGLLLPGLGGDKRMFDPILRSWKGPDVQWDVFCNEVPRVDDELPRYAARNFQEQGHQRDYDVVMAASFGGMICQELLRQGILRAKLVILISTALRGTDLGIGGRLSAFTMGLVPHVLGGLVKAVFVFCYPFVRFSMKEGKDFAAMFNDQPALLLFRVPKMIRHWKGGLPHAGKGRILHFQGTSDPLISYRSVAEKQIPDFPVYRGSHLIFVTHAQWIADEISRAIGRSA